MTAIRISDAEREAAISALADHYAAGRLTKDEYDERADRVNSARFDDDLTPLFADLPAPASARDASASAGSRGRRQPNPALLIAPQRLAPVFAIAAIALVATAAVVISPWLLLAAFWFACAGPACGSRSRHHGSWAGRRQSWQRV